MKNITNFPPSWCPDAVPSDRGWRHPKTGELLVSVRGGVRQFKEAVKPEKLILEIPETKPIISEVETETVIDENVKGEDVIPDENAQEVITEKKVASKRRRGKNGIPDENAQEVITEKKVASKK